MKKLYDYGDLVVIRGDPDHKVRQAVRVYSEFVQPQRRRFVCVLLPSGCGVGVPARYVHKAKRDSSAAKFAWILSQKRPACDRAKPRGAA